MNNKKITLLIIIGAVLIIILGVVMGISTQEKADPVYKNTDTSGEITNNSDSETENLCYITINGKTYDVTDFRKTHSGGDTFRCGEDMTESFRKKHGYADKMLEAFLVTE